LGSAAPEQVDGYDPGGLDEVAVVEQVGAVAGAAWPKRNPEYEGLIVGTLPVSTIEALDAVTVTGPALVTLSEPAV
jgi:hypothetical protein